jgi:hypothetical protein
VSQTKSDSVESAQLDVIYEKFHEDYVCAQASQSALHGEIHKLIIVDLITQPKKAINQRLSNNQHVYIVDAVVTTL